MEREVCPKMRRQPTLEDVDFSIYSVSEPKRFGYGPVATAIAEGREETDRSLPRIEGGESTFPTPDSDISRYSEVSELAQINGINRIAADRLIQHFGSLEAVYEVAQKGTDENGYDELVSVPAVSTRSAAKLRLWIRRREAQALEGGES